MALRTIHTWPSKVLKRRAAPVEENDGGLQQLIDDMLETMYAAPGIGLAAPQVGVSRRLIVLDLSSGTVEGQAIVLINPEIISSEGEAESEEGCLSLPEHFFSICRPEKVVVRGSDRHGSPVEIEGCDLLARALLHEIDHINGVLLIDHLHPIRREIVRKKLKKTLAPSG